MLRFGKNDKTKIVFHFFYFSIQFSNFNFLVLQLLPTSMCEKISLSFCCKWSPAGLWHLQGFYPLTIRNCLTIPSTPPPPALKKIFIKLLGTLRHPSSGLRASSAGHDRPSSAHDHLPRDGAHSRDGSASRHLDELQLRLDKVSYRKVSRFF